MTAYQKPPMRHWLSHSDGSLPSPNEALAQPLRASPSWFLRIECERCGKGRLVDEAPCGATYG